MLNDYIVSPMNGFYWDDLMVAFCDQYDMNATDDDFDDFVKMYCAA